MRNNNSTLTVECHPNLARQAGKVYVVTLYIASRVPKMLAHTLSSYTHPLYNFSESHIIAVEKRFTIHSRTLGGGFATAIVLLLFIWIAICLGRRRERTGTWCCWGDTGSRLGLKSRKTPELGTAPEWSRHINRISWPDILSSARAELGSPVSPVEADSQSPFLELSSKEIYEMASPSPNPRRSNWTNGTVWWNRYGGRRQESNATSERSSNEIEAGSARSPPYPEAAHVPSRKTGEEKQRESSGPSMTDKRSSGLEYVRQIYAQKKTDLAVEGTPWY